MRVHKIRDYTQYLFYAQLIMGTLALMSIVAYEPLFDLMAQLDKALERTNEDYRLYHLARFGMALGVMLPITFFAGMTLPLTTINMLKHGYSRKSIGWIYAANTLGCIVGVLLAIHYFMPTWSKLGVVLAGSLVDLLVAISLSLGCYINRS